MPRLNSGTACDRQEINETAKLPPIPEAGWQQHSETSIKQHRLNITNIDSTSQNTQETQKAAVASQT